MQNRMHMANSYDPSSPAGLDQPAQALLERRQRVLGASYRLFYERPVRFVRGAGALLYDEDGADYLDAYNNVPVVGHSNPRVQAAVARQLGLLNTHTRYLTDDIVDYAEDLAALFPHPLDQIIFACTGSEAVDLALRVARHCTGAEGIVATSHAYHGTTTAAAAVSPSLGPNNPIPRSVVLVDAPDMIRDRDDGAIDSFPERVGEAIRELGRRGIRFAGMIMDSVLSSDGLQLVPPDALQAAAETVRAQGGLVIADEVQSGFGRTGSWWGFERNGVSPDLVVLGKPMGNGVPIAAVVGSAALFDRFGRDIRYFNTFGGNPVSVAAGRAVLAELRERELIASADRVGRDLLAALSDLTADDPGVAGVRGAGLFLGVELVTDPETLHADPGRALRVVNRMREHRILISASGAHGNVLKIRPPLVFRPEHGARLLEGFADSLAPAGGAAD
jgi:4-aminobutyrate aminotransferase-like enzyme